MTHELLRILGKFLLAMLHKNKELFNGLITDELNALAEYAEDQTGAMSVRSGALGLIGKLIFLAIHDDQGAINDAATKALNQVLGVAEDKANKLAQ